MFTKYFLYKGLYYSNKQVYLNDNLFRKAGPHFPAEGVGVLNSSSLRLNMVCDHHIVLRMMSQPLFGLWFEECLLIENM